MATVPLSKIRRSREVITAEFTAKRAERDKLHPNHIRRQILEAEIDHLVDEWLAASN